MRKIIYSDEVIRSKKALKQAKSQNKKADELISALKTELAKVIDDFDRQLTACRPKTYQPSSAESEEIEKLEGRRTELLDMYTRKTLRKG